LRILQEAVEKALQGLPLHALTQLIVQKLAAQGVKLSTRQRELLRNHLEQGGAETFSLRSWRWWERRKIIISFTPQEAKEVTEKIAAFLENRLADLFAEAAEDLSKSVLADLKHRWSAESRRNRRQIDGFRRRLYKRWKLPLEGLNMLLTVSREFGASINEELRQSPDPSIKFLVEVLTRSHARACQVAEEIVCLLDGGFADGAMARWRTLHEIAVVALFISAHGEDLAERYVMHQKVESRRAAVEYEKVRGRLKYEPLDAKEVKQLEDDFAAVITRFGPTFKEQYGWAAQQLGNPKPTFADIERAARIDHLRAHYRMASHNVHANPKGVFFKLGLLHETHILLSGPSNAGLADPGHGAAISLAQVSTTLSLLHPTLDTNVSLRVIAQLVHEVGEMFGQAHIDLENDAASA